MIILQLSTVKTWAGGEVHFYDLVQGMRQKGHKVLAICRKNSCLAQRLPAEDKFYISSGIRGVMQLAAIIKKHKVQLVHAHAGKDYRLAVIAAKMVGNCKIVLTRHILLPLKNDFISCCLRSRADKFIAVSQSVAEVLREKNNIPDCKIKVIHNGIDLQKHKRVSESKESLRKKYGIAGGKAVIGCIGRLAAEKGQSDLIEIFNKLTLLYPDTVLCLAGSGEDEKKLKSLAEKLNIKDKVRFLGFINNTAEFMALLDIFILPSRNEPFGLVILEAMAQGVPVIARKAGGVPEIVEDKKNGFLFSTDEECLELIKVLLERKKYAINIGENGLKTVFQKFSIGKMLDNIEYLYNDILK